MHDLLREVSKNHLGIALQSPDLTAVWGFRILLGRDFHSLAEYRDAVASLPTVVLGARGPRSAFALRLLQSPEFTNGNCSRSSQCVETALNYFLCLNYTKCTKGYADVDIYKSSTNMNLMVAKMSSVADSIGLFGNAALIDPTWCIGC